MLPWRRGGALLRPGARRQMSPLPLGVLPLSWISTHPRYIEYHLCGLLPQTWHYPLSYKTPLPPCRHWKEVKLTLLVTCNVESLYSNTEHNLGMEVVAHFLKFNNHRHVLLTSSISFLNTITLFLIIGFIARFLAQPCRFVALSPMPTFFLIGGRGCTYTLDLCTKKRFEMAQLHQQHCVCVYGH